MTAARLSDTDEMELPSRPYRLEVLWRLESTSLLLALDRLACPAGTSCAEQVSSLVMTS
jgi:hypothetical protein